MNYRKAFDGVRRVYAEAMFTPDWTTKGSIYNEIFNAITVLVNQAEHDHKDDSVVTNADWRMEVNNSYEPFEYVYRAMARKD